MKMSFPLGLVCILMVTLGASHCLGQDWQLTYIDGFDREGIGPDWTAWIVAGDPCGYISIGGGILGLKSQCGCGYDYPADTYVQLVYPLESNYKVVCRLNKAYSCGWDFIQVSDLPGVFPLADSYGLYLNGDGVGGAYGSVSLRKYIDEVTTGLDGTEYPFGIGTYNVWVLTRVGNTVTIEVGATEATVLPLLEATDASLFSGGYLNIRAAGAGAIANVDYVKVYGDSSVVANENLRWGSLKQIYSQ